jgi:hypothetical protein
MAETKALRKIKDTKALAEKIKRSIEQKDRMLIDYKAR